MALAHITAESSARDSAQTENSPEQNMKTQSVYNTFSIRNFAPAYLTIRLYLLSLIFIASSFRAIGQISFSERRIEDCCIRHTFANCSKDTLYVLDYGLFPRYEGGCIINMGFVDTVNKLTHIYIGTTRNDYQEVEMPYWIYLHPGDSTSFNIKLCKYLDYDKEVLISYRAFHAKYTTGKRPRVSNRRVYKKAIVYKKYVGKL